MENTNKKKYDLYFTEREMEILENIITEETEKEFLYFTNKIHKENCDNLNLKKNWKKIKRLGKILFKIEQSFINYEIDKKKK